jgi:hypothetical protein
MGGAGPASRVAARGASEGPVARTATANAQAALTQAASPTGYLLWENTTTGDRGFWPLDGDYPAGGWMPLTNIPTEWRVACTADFDADGRHDILWHNTATGDFGFWLMDGVNAAPSGYIPLTVIATEWSVVGCADVNADASPDLLWRNATTGDMGFWTMRGTAPDGSGYRPLTTIGAEWQVAAFADFSGDGHPDILWQNLTTGDRGFWPLDASARATQGWVPLTVIDPVWVIAFARVNAASPAALMWHNTATGERGWWILDHLSQSVRGYVPFTTIANEWRATAVIPSYVPVGYVEIGGLAAGAGLEAGGGIYVGGESQLTVTLAETIYGPPVEPRHVTWTSSDPSRLRVDDTGHLTALAAGGPVRVIAAAEGVADTALVTVLPRPVPDLSLATDWVMFQGNARHDGYVDVTLDPLRFRERWVQPVAVPPYYPPVVARGRLFLYGPQNVTALAESDGSLLWSRDFPNVRRVRQPAWYDGTLYVSSYNPDSLWALGEADGATRFQVPACPRAAIRPGPVVAEGTVFVQGSTMCGYDASTGARRYTITGGGSADWAPAVANGLVYRPGDSSLDAFRVADGTLAFQVSDSRLDLGSTPVIGRDGKAYVSAWFNLVAVDLADRAVAWSRSLGDEGVPLVAGAGMVFQPYQNVLHAMRSSDGEPQYHLFGGSPWSMVLTRNLLFVSGGLRAGTVAFDVATGLPVWSHPAVGQLAMSANGILFIVVGGSKVVAISVNRSPRPQSSWTPRRIRPRLPPHPRYPGLPPPERRERPRDHDQHDPLLVHPAHQHQRGHGDEHHPQHHEAIDPDAVVAQRARGLLGGFGHSSMSPWRCWVPRVKSRNGATASPSRVSNVSRRGWRKSFSRPTFTSRRTSASTSACR